VESLPGGLFSDANSNTSSTVQGTLLVAWFSVVGTGTTLRARSCVRAPLDDDAAVFDLTVYSGSCGDLTCVTASTRPPTPAPTRPPTLAPTRPPTPAPTRPPTPAPTRQPTLALTRQPVSEDLVTFEPTSTSASEGLLETLEPTSNQNVPDFQFVCSFSDPWESVKDEVYYIRAETPARNTGVEYSIRVADYMFK
jgi:hypothetical protein